MFDEPTNGGFDDGYAGGGLVAFAMGNEVEEEEDPEDQYAGPPSRIGPNGEIIVDATVNKPAQMAYFPATPDFKTPQNISGYSGDLVSNLDRYTEAAPRKTERAEQFAKYLDQMMSPESQKARRKEDMYLALGQIGAKMATTPGSILQAASAGIGEALPGIAASAKERKADQRQLLKNLQEQEGLTNKEAKEAANIALDMQTKYGTLALALQDQSFKERWAQMDDATRRYIGKLTAESSAYSTRMGYLGTMGSANLALTREYLNQDSMARKSVDDSIGPGGALAFQYGQAVDAGTGEQFYQKLLRNALGRDPITPTNSGGYGAPPPGAVTPVKPGGK
jgi:hypothetical protein